MASDEDPDGGDKNVDVNVTERVNQTSRYIRPESELPPSPFLLSTTRAHRPPLLSSNVALGVLPPFCYLPPSIPILHLNLVSLARRVHTRQHQNGQQASPHIQQRHHPLRTLHRVPHTPLTTCLCLQPLSW